MLETEFVSFEASSHQTNALHIRIACDESLAQESFSSLSEVILIKQLAIIIANLTPLLGVFLYGLTIFDIILIFWVETASIAFYTIIKLLFCKDIIPAKLLGITFFPIHMGGFMLGHLFFILAINSFLSGDSKLQTDLVFSMLSNSAYAIASLFISHGISLVINYFGKGEYKKATVEMLIKQPYIRVIPMHLFLLFGFGIALFFQDAIFITLLFILIKIVFDVILHTQERLKFIKAIN